ncbi:putative glycosyl hydrolase family 10 protein 2 [Elsinoe fawcettii]|nr:putative glycosyl hydrolase family 10 protein 2 [Elsinoe fawcettii]
MKFDLSTVTAVLACASAVSARPQEERHKSQGLYKAIKDRGRGFLGTALTLRSPADTQEAAIYGNKNDFNSITPENAQKWESTEPARGQFTFDQADAHIKYATDNKLQTHCHTLVWHSQLPAWVSSGGFDNATLIQVMRDHIQAVAGRYKGRCTRWDVVNEALNEDGTYRESVFYNTIGEAYIPIAFKFAREVDPHAKLFYNDYNLEYAGAKAEGAKRIVQLIKSYGVKIDGVGLQAHLASETTPTAPGAAPDEATLRKALQLYTSEKVDVIYTEIDIRMNTPATPEKLAVQAAAFERVARSCLAEKRCVGMTLWGVSDRYSWIPGVFAGEGAALVWDENYQKKPAYAGFLKAGLTSTRYPNPGYLGSSSLSNVFDQIPADVNGGLGEQSRDRLPAPGAISNLVGEEQLAYGARLLESLAQAMPIAASSRLIQRWIERGINLALAELISRQCYESAVEVIEALRQKTRSADELSQLLYRNSSEAVLMQQNTTVDQLCGQFCGSSARWETIGLFVTAVARAAGDYATFDGLYDYDTRLSFERAIMHLSDSILGICLTLDCLNDLQLALQYENFILHSCTEGDQSYNSWRRLGDVISSLFALGHHRQTEVKTSLPPFVVEMRRTAFARAYSADKNVSIFLGRPPRLHRRYCQFYLPHSEILVRGGDRSPLHLPVPWLEEDLFNYTTDTKWAAICGILKADLLDIMEEDESDDRRRRIDLVVECANVQWDAFPAHMRLDQPLRFYEMQPFRRDLLVGSKLNYLHTLFLAQLARSNRVIVPEQEMIKLSIEILGLAVEAALLKHTLANSGTSLVWKVAYYGLAAAGMICLALLNPALRAHFDAEMPKVIQDLQVLVAQVETGALVRFEEANFGLLAAATRTIQNLLNRIITGRLPHHQFNGSRQSSAQPLDAQSEVFWDTWTHNELPDFEADFWLNLGEHPLLTDAEHTATLIDQDAATGTAL